MTGRLLGCLLTLALAAAAAFSQEAEPASAPASAPAPAKTPAPSPAALKAAAKLANEIYAAELAKAKTVPDRVALGKKLLQAGAGAQGDEPGRFVLLGLAADVAVQAGDIETAFAAAEELGRGFDIDALKRKADVAAKLAAARSPDVSALEGRFTALIDEALAADRYELATQVAEQALALGKRTGDRGAAQAAATQLQDVNDIAASHENATRALAVLTADPNNTAAYLTVGRFYCFAKGDWAKGLPMLASASDRPLKVLAEKEIAARAEPPAQIDVADGWWDLAQNEQGLTKRRMLDHARDWYTKAQPAAVGLLKLKVEARLAAMPDRTTIATEVAALPRDLRNISSGGTYIASSRWPQDPPPQPSLLQTSLPEPRYAFHTQNEKQPYIIITLAQGSFLRAFSIRNRRDATQERAESLTAWTSSDGKHWQPLWSAKDAKDTWHVLLNHPLWVRYVKLGLQKPNWFHLSRVELFSDN
ncbi:MAG: discoidin domain-containing protein [Planctomycetota bacterium]|nr:discoidin domain-containing protein [Planctomycetota bacterium]